MLQQWTLNAVSCQYRISILRHVIDLPRYATDNTAVILRITTDAVGSRQFSDLEASVKRADWQSQAATVCQLIVEVATSVEHRH